jgi:hypothetical protein
MPEWTIDTFDPRGGLAFASWWDDPNASGNPGSEPTCIFVGAPDFRPEVVANRAIALAAGRGSFQTGLFVGPVEVPFPTVSAVAEFVRRVYLRGGGGDGADGGGGDGPPPRPVERPDLPLLPELTEEGYEGRGLRSEILAAVENFQLKAKGVAIESAPRSVEWPAAIEGTNGGGGAHRAGDGPAMLASAALRLIYEMARRLPSAGAPAALARWQREAQTLGRLISNLGLWPLLLSGPYYGSLRTLASSLVRGNYGLAILDILKGGFPSEFLTNVVMYLLFVGGLPLDDRDEAEWLFYHWRRDHYPFDLPPWNSSVRGAIDPVAALRRIPLPEELTEFVGSTLKDGTSLYHAVNAFMGSPQTIWKQGQAAQLIDIVLFASASIVETEGGQFLSELTAWMFWNGPRTISPTRRVAIQTAADNAWSWLAQHLPALVFGEALENVIESAGSLRYRTAA